MILEGSGPTARHPALPSRPGRLQGHPKGYGLSATTRGTARPSVPHRRAPPINNSPHRGGTRETHRDKSQASKYRARRPARPRRTRRPMREDAGVVSVTRSPGLDAASIALPANITLDDRAARMNDVLARVGGISGS